MRVFLLAIRLVFGGKGFAQPVITTDSVLQLGVCAGSNVIVPFSVTGGNFQFGNVFTAQLSDPLGQFTNPVSIGSIPWFSSGLIFATLPQNVTFSFLYRVRVVASNPSVTGSPSPNTIIVAQLPFVNNIFALPNDTVCVGDTVTLGIPNPAASFQWSTGDTTQFIQVTSSGSYICTTTDFMGCITKDTMVVVFETCTGISENDPHSLFSVYPNPSTGQITFVPAQGKLSEEGTISVFNTGLQKVFTRRVASGTGSVPLDLSELQSGIYFFEFRTHSGSLMKKIVLH